jgi:hypothetical protein
MSLGTVAAVVGIAAGVNSIANSGGGQSQSDATQQGAQQADPFAALRPYFQSALQGQWQDLSNMNPESILKNPNFQFLQEIGQGGRYGAGIPGQNAAEFGSNRNGKLAMDLSSFNQGLASNFIQQQFENNMRVLGFLGGASGIGFGDPGSAGRITAGGPAASQNFVTNGVNAIGSGINGLKPLFNSGSGSGISSDPNVAFGSESGLG